jgi:hypothetical protein
MTAIINPDFRAGLPSDMLGNELKIGDRVARAVGNGSPHIEIRTVTKIKDGKVYLNESHVALHYPGLLLVVNKLFEA